MARAFYDIAVVGGGIVGCATARHLRIARPDLSIALLEKEPTLGAHQSGHNSGVLHAGIYYTPGSLKAKLCIDLAYKYLEKKNIPHKKVGKLIVAVEKEEIPRLDALYERANQNNCKGIEFVDSKKIQEIEPHCRGLKAIWSGHTGIVDWGVVTKSYGKDFEEAGGKIYYNHPLRGIKLASENPGEGKENKYPVKVTSDAGKDEIYCRHLITCAGLFSDRVAALTGCSSEPRIVPFRGEYLILKPEKKHLVHTNIYPVPDSRFPFLGVHFTPTMKGEILLGPNAVLAFKREGYSYFDISLSDLKDALSYKGMHKLIAKYTTYGVSELYRGIIIAAQVKQLRRYVPELRLRDVKRGLTGVRAQALGPDGSLIEDFIFDGGEGELGSRVLHVRNAPSPGATSSLSIAKMITQKASEKFNLGAIDSNVV
uniref:L-2-hydroxyglutarate dehydrogenase, mitochondrial n=1 Tax=Acrobeloides nanus TaxID=290746 RepID=A0A914CCJ7_9BILA